MPKKSKPPANGRSNATDGVSIKKPPKKFKVVLKRRDPIADSEEADDQPRKAGSAPTKPFEQCLIEYVDASASPELSAKYAALCGAARPIAKPLACDRALMREVELGLGRDLRNYLAENPCKVGLQVTRLGVVSGDAVIISVMEARKAKALYERAKVDGFAAIRACPVPQTDTALPGIAVDVVTVVFGNDADSKLALASARSRGPDRFERSRMEWMEGDDFDEIELTLSSMISPPFHGLPEFSPFTESGARFDSRCESGLRAMITLMCRSQLPLKKMLMGFGGGKRMVKRATADVEDSLKARCRAEQQIVHQDEVPHFWSSELRRLGWNHISVPIVKLH